MVLQLLEVAVGAHEQVSAHGGGEAVADAPGRAPFARVQHALCGVSIEVFDEHILQGAAHGGLARGLRIVLAHSQAGVLYPALPRVDQEPRCLRVGSSVLGATGGQPPVHAIRLTQSKRYDASITENSSLWIARSGGCLGPTFS